MYGYAIPNPDASFGPAFWADSQVLKAGCLPPLKDAELKILLGVCLDISGQFF